MPPSFSTISKALYNCARQSHLKEPNTSEVKHEECTLTKTSSRLTSPLTKAICFPNWYNLNIPNSLGKFKTTFSPFGCMLLSPPLLYQFLTPLSVNSFLVHLFLKQLEREKQKNIKEGNFSSQKRDVSLERKIFIFKKIKYKKISICKKTRPIPGDKIIGILKDENIIVKRKTNENSKKFIQIKWNLKEKNLYTSEIILTLLNRKGSLFEVLNTFRKLNINILDSFTKVKSVKPELGYAKYMIEVESLSALNFILNNLKNLECVIEARRSMDQ